MKLWRYFRMKSSLFADDINNTAIIYLTSIPTFFILSFTRSHSVYHCLICSAGEHKMIYQLADRRVVGPAGDLLIPDGDEITPRLLMLIEGQCEGLGPMLAAQKYGLSRQRYYQVQKQFRKNGIPALFNQKRGPKSNSVRTDEVERQVIRHRFLDPDASVDIIAQKLRQAGFEISNRSVERVIEKYGLQKKTLSLPPGL
jgi:transposase